MSQQVRKRPQTTLQFSINNTVSDKLSRGMVYRELYVRLQGAPTLTNANNTVANTAIGDEWGVVKKIEIIANNTDVLFSMSGNALWWLNKMFYGKSPLLTTTLGDGATANPAFDSMLLIPFWMPKSIRPIDTALDARELSDLKIAVTWGTFTDVNSAATAWTTNPTLQVHSLESFNVKGPFSQKRIYTIQQTIAASNPQFQVQLPVGPMYRGFLINTTDAGVDSEAILNNFKLVSGSTVFADVPETVLRDAHQLRENIARDFSGTAYTKSRISTKNLFNGWYFYDHVTDGFLSEAIDTLGFSEFNIIADVTLGGGTTNLNIFPIQVIPVRGKAAA